jgi:predicted amidohydrolase
MISFAGKIMIFGDDIPDIFNFTHQLRSAIMQDLKITLVQTDLSWEDREENLARFDGLLERIGSTDLILLPETFNTGFSINPAKCAEPPDGPSMHFLRQQAARKNAIIMATLLILEEEGCYNRLVCMHPDGHHEIYDKRHLFRLSEEYRIFRGGEKQFITGIKGWNVAAIICYDLRFPVWCRNTWNDGKYGYDLLVCLANWPASRLHVWNTLLAARAIENQAYVAGVNRVGMDGHGTGHAGGSLVADPKGMTRYRAGEDEAHTETVVLSAADLEIFRESFTVGMDWDQFTINNIR